MPSETFLWHDYETYGLSRLDRPAQFAAVRTDLNLNVVEEHRPVYAKPTPDYLPSPQAVLVTGITPQYGLENGLTEQNFSRHIEQLMMQPGTISVGYNSLRFDDEVTRHLFWRNLRDPYAREWKNGCSRWDLINVLRCAWALRPEGIEWPLIEKSPGVFAPSFKLTDLTEANNLTHINAHDALSDVYATLEIAKLLKAKQPRLFDYFLSNRKKEAVRASTLAAKQHKKPLLHVESIYGASRGYLAPLWPIATNPSNPNEYICWNLRQDPSELFSLSALQIRERLFSKERDSDAARLGLHTIAVNRCPTILQGLSAIPPDGLEKWAIDPALCSQRIEALLDHAAELSLLWADVYTPPGPFNADVDAKLYDGFVSKLDQGWMSQLQEWTASDWKNRPFSSFEIFADERIEKLAWRYLCRNHPEALTPAEKTKWMQHCHQILTQPSPADGLHPRTFDQFEAEIAQLASTCSCEKQSSLLANLLLYGNQLKAKLNA